MTAVTGPCLQSIVFALAFVSALAECSVVQALALGYPESGHRPDTPPEPTGSAAPRGVAPWGSVDLARDDLPPGAVARMGTVRFRHHDLIRSLAVSPDEKTVATGGWDPNSTSEQPIRLWDAATGKELRQLRGHLAPPDCIVFSPDGTRLASGAGWTVLGQDDTVRLWDVATGKSLQVFRGHQAAENPESNRGPGKFVVCFSPDGRLLASYGGRDDFVRLWEASTGKELRRWAVGASALAFSPDGRMLACAAGAALHLWEVGTGNEVGRPPPGPWSSYFFRFSPDGQAIISATGNWRKLSDWTVHWWDHAAGRELSNVSGRVIASSADGQQVALQGDIDIQIRDASTGKEIRRFPSRLMFNYGVVGALCGNGKTLLGAAGNAVAILDTQNGNVFHPVEGHSGEVVFVGFSADGKRLYSVGDTAVRGWDVATGRDVQQFRGQQQAICSASLTADARVLATGSRDGTIRLWDLPTSQQLRQFVIPASTSPLVALSGDGSVVAAKARYGNEKGIRLWEAATGKELRKFWVGNAGDALAFFPDGKTLAELNGCIHLFDPSDGRHLRELTETSNGGSGPTALRISPDGRVLATGYLESKSSDASTGLRTVSLWEVATGKMIAQFRGHERPVRTFDFSPDGKVLASGSWDGTIRLWEVATGRELKRFSGHRGGVASLAFSPDARLLASGGSDTSVLLWDVANLTRERRLPPLRLTQTDLEALWSDLRETDAPIGYRAIWRLVAGAPQAVPFLRDHLKATQFDPKRVRQLISCLDDERFEVRERATQDLAGFGRAAELELREALKGSPSAEARRRLQGLLDSLRRHRSGSQDGALDLRGLRALQVLEYSRTPEAHQLLEMLARGETREPLAREASASLERLRRSRP